MEAKKTIYIYMFYSWLPRVASMPVRLHGSYNNDLVNLSDDTLYQGFDLGTFITAFGLP